MQMSAEKDAILSQDLNQLSHWKGCSRLISTQEETACRLSNLPLRRCGRGCDAAAKGLRARRVLPLGASWLVFRTAGLSIYCSDKAE